MGRVHHVFCPIEPSYCQSHYFLVHIKPPDEWGQSRLPEPLENIRTFYDDGHLTVAAKPISPGQLRSIIKFEEGGCLIFDPMVEETEQRFRTKGYYPPGTYRYKHKKYQYDYVFGPQVTQLEVFEKTTKLLLNGFLDGYNVTVFVYGVSSQP